MKSLLLILTQIFLVASLQAQTYSTKKNAPSKALKSYEKGQTYMMSKDLEKAIKEFDKALDIAPNFIDAFLLRADANNQGRNLVAAEADFKKVLELDPDYKPKVHYVLGMILFRQERYAEAASYLEKFLAYPNKNESFKKKIERQLSNANFAKEAIKKPLPFTPVNMGKGVNSEHMDYWPSISVDGETFVFTRQVGQNEDFWVSKRKDGIWQAATNLGAPVNTPQNEGAQSLSADGRYLAFTVCNRPGDMGKCDIYISSNRNGAWTSPRNIGAPVSSSQWESQPTLSADGNTLFFVRSADSRARNSDIMVSYRKEGKWTKPERLGKNINTPYGEEAPFLHPDGQTLYFVSNGHPGFGEGDVFLSRKQADGTWGKAKNIGYPLNTADDEFGLIISFNGETGFFTSDQEGGKGKFDIYSFPLPKEIKPQPATYVKAIVYDAVTKKNLVADAEFVDLAQDLTHASSQTNEQGQFLVCLPLGKDYALNVSKPKYLFHSENFALQAQSSREEPYLLEIYLQPIPPKKEVTVTTTSPAPVSKPIILKNVFFDTGSAVLLDLSKTELNKLVQLLTENPDMKIRLNGHTDNVGSDSDNMLLSTNRAKSVREYLERNGISPSRLSSKGFGETSPIDTNDTPEGRANNRRTEFEIM